jgi:hypothetical protein
MERREKVLEHRVSGSFRGYLVRWWIESDPAFGGIGEPADAVLAARGAERRAAEQLGLPNVWNPKALVQLLLEECPAASCVEVTYEGCGYALYRNWP